MVYVFILNPLQSIRVISDEFSKSQSKSPTLQFLLFATVSSLAWFSLLPPAYEP